MKLLCATDLLPKSESAIDRAGILAEELGADLSLLHVVSPTASERVLEQSLEIAIARMRSRGRPPLWRRGPTPNVIVRAGNPARLICDTIANELPDLVVVGPHERRNVVDGLSGTIAERILSARKCPLLMVRRRPDAGYRNVLFALDPFGESGLAVCAAESLVLGAEARATVLHVSEPSIKGMLPSGNVATAEIPRNLDAPDSAAAAIRSLLREQSTNPERYDVVIEAGHPVAAILRAVEIHRPELLIMGTRGAGRMRRALLGSVAGQLLKEVVECDVLVVPRDSIATSITAGAERSALLSA